MLCKNGYILLIYNHNTSSINNLFYNSLYSMNIYKYFTIFNTKWLSIYLQLHLIVLVKNAKGFFVRKWIYGIYGLLLSYVTVNESDISLL